eukprot:NODE_23527_length_662_cov_5.611215.p4 GENE.NODE_23527_length_662_cov_5.611215~~NODE_23527_length_662_cov_5.611215.p4  ORF type:complete len:71 (+),score=3.20 NODE_23527_length_662_cov_5.611215:72-284(+)
MLKRSRRRRRINLTSPRRQAHEALAAVGTFHVRSFVATATHEAGTLLSPAGVIVPPTRVEGLAVALRSAA